MQNRVEEIRSFLNHQDYSLAVRRMLDLCLDFGNHQLIARAIALSKTYRLHENKKVSSLLPNAFLEQANFLLAELENTYPHSVIQQQKLLSAKNISKTYAKGNFSLQSINFELKTSEVVGVVGENGNGKTTLLRCLAGQLAIDTGSITYTLLQNPDYYDVKNHVVFIPQRIPRWYGLLKDNLHFSASLAGLTGKENELMVEFMLERLNLSSYAHLTWNQISSGYRTRFELARILLQKPSLLILDEPLANLDINAQQTILTDLWYIAKSESHPLGIILSSQQLHEVEKVADSVLFIKQGACLFRTGDIAEIAVSNVIELETSAERNAIIQILGEQVQVQFNGGFYTLTSSTLSSNEIILKLLEQNISINYFRDITKSTKRYFN